MILRTPSPSWVHDGDGLVAWDVAATTTVRGLSASRGRNGGGHGCASLRSSTTRSWHRVRTGRVRLFLLRRRRRSVVTVPGTIVGQRDGKAWITTITPTDPPHCPHRVGSAV